MSSVPPVIPDKDKGNVCGIIGCCIGWLIPLAGLILGVISLARGEKSKALGIAAICVSTVFWLFHGCVRIALAN